MAIQTQQATPTLDPRSRIEVACAGGWSIRVVPRNSFRHQLCVANGTLRLQLLHLGTGISLLTRCKGSDWRFQLDDDEGRRLICCWGAVKRALGDRAPLPCVPWVREHEAFWVHLAQLGATRRLLLANHGPD